MAAHLGRALERRRLVLGRRRPLSVEVRAARVGAQVAAQRAVGVHVGHDVEGELAQERDGEAIGRRRGRRASSAVAQPEQAAQQALRVEARLRLARMLAVDHPAVQRPVARLDAVELASVERLPE